nr:MAG TPA: hypothetical protein [Caudoviricetes sp.]
MLPTEHSTQMYLTGSRNCHNRKPQNLICENKIIQ